MPNIWTHIKFGESVAKAAKFDVSNDLKAYFNLGAQGPDPFFYHNFWPWIKEKPVEEMGSKVHYEYCGPFLLEMIKYAGQHESDRKLKAYVMGFLTHHVLDRNAHPYIIYRSGNEGHKHQKLEVIIDTLLMKKWHGIETWRTPVYKQLSVGKHLDASIAAMLSNIIVATFPETARKMPRDYIDKSYRSMILAQRILFDPKGWKNKLLKELISSYSYQKHIDEKDYLNESQTEWLHPTDASEVHNESLEQLIEQGKREGINILTLVQAYWAELNDDNLEVIEEALGNRSYDTGKDCTLPLENKYFDPIL